MTSQFHYVQISNYFFCLQQNPAVLAWILYLKRNDLTSICTPWLKKTDPEGIVNAIRYHCGIFTGNFKILLLFILYRLRLRDSKSVLTLPVYGHLCLHVHKGYKTFNLVRGVVVKIFDSDVNRNSIISELERLRNVSHIKFAPTLGKYNVDQRWYEEDYVSESPPSSYKSLGPEDALAKFNNEIIPCLKELMEFRQPEFIDAFNYVNRIIETSELGRILKQESETKIMNLIRHFVHSMIDRLQSTENPGVYLTFSHGDFCPANILDTKGGVRILDWEGAEYRSALFDFYSYFFYLSACLNHPMVSIVDELNNNLEVFAVAGAMKPHISENLISSVNTYRWIFYLEMICRLVEREGTDNNLNIMDFISRYISSFTRYEELEGSPVKIMTGHDK